MKKLFYSIVFSLTATLAIILSNVLGVDNLQSVIPTNYIKNIHSETLVLISNNIKTAEISSRQLKNNLNLSNSSSLIMDYQPLVNLFTNNNDAESYHYNFQNYKQIAHQIRAP